jgi:prephenate dehydrogenase
MGLIGSSLGMALKKAGIPAEIVGTDRDRGVARRAQRAGASDRTETNPLSAIRGSKMVILATPVGGIKDLLELFGPELEDGCIVTDTGSTKTEVLRWAEQYLTDRVNFIGGHPMAGREVSGPEGAQADLFKNATYCIIPGKNASQKAIEAVIKLADTIEAKPYFIDPVEHDSFVAAVSHLPLVLSSLLVKINADDPSWPEVSKLASTGFKDLTRLASGSPEMSRDICATNPELIIRWLDKFKDEIDLFKKLLEDGNPDVLWQFFDNTWEARDRWMQNKIEAKGLIPTQELPSTIETMGGMVLGDRASSKLREMYDWQNDPKQK